MDDHLLSLPRNPLPGFVRGQEQCLGAARIQEPAGATATFRSAVYHETTTNSGQWNVSVKSIEPHYATYFTIRLQMLHLTIRVLSIEHSIVAINFEVTQAFYMYIYLYSNCRINLGV